MRSSRLIAGATVAAITLASSGLALAQENTTTPANTTTPTTTTATTNNDGGFDWGWLGLLGLIGLAGLRGGRRDTHVHSTTTGTRP